MEAILECRSTSNGLEQNRCRRLKFTIWVKYDSILSASRLSLASRTEDNSNECYFKMTGQFERKNFLHRESINLFSLVDFLKSGFTLSNIINFSDLKTYFGSALFRSSYLLDCKRASTHWLCLSYFDHQQLKYERASLFKISRNDNFLGNQEKWNNLSQTFKSPKNYSY